MSDNKKYYYLKLKDNFFDSDEIVALEKNKNGSLYSIFYLKILCKSDYYIRGYRYICNKYFDTHLEFLSLKLNLTISEVNESILALEDNELIRFEGRKIIIKDINIDIERNRTTKQYKDWRKSVFERDNFTCQNCHERGVRLNAHHIKPWAKYPEYRFELENGLTLCEKCHVSVHRERG